MSVANRKKSMEKVGYHVEQSPLNPGAPYQIYKHANGKIELRSISNNAPNHSKLKPSIGGGGNDSSLGLNDSIGGASLDIQGKSVAAPASTKPVNMNYV